MRVRNHLLVGDDGNAVRFSASPNVSAGIDQKYIVIHYTAGTRSRSAENTFLDRSAKTSAHLIIDRDGAILQMVAFNRRAWHAGVSRWRGLDYLNSFAIGIELVNAGRLKKVGERWLTWIGQEIPVDDVMVATHKHETAPAGWQLYTEAQLMATIAVCQTLRQAYAGILDVIGHDDIAPTRKSDPGPAFPMDSVRSRAMGRGDDEMAVLHVTTARVNLRQGPGTSFELVQPSPLDIGTRLAVRARAASWCAVDVLDGAGDAIATGWVHGDYIKPVT
jgi:N-acetylmuramoyl-L-alanine amidase